MSRKRASFRRRTSSESNLHILARRNCHAHGIQILRPTGRYSTAPNLPGETNRQFAIRARAEQAAAAALEAKEARKPRTKKAAA